MKLPPWAQFAIDVAPWLNIVPLGLIFAGIALYVAAVWPLALLSGVWHWVSTVITRLGLWYGLRSAAISGLGDDAIWNSVKAVSDRPDRFEVSPYPLSAELEHEAMLKANASATALGNSVIQSFRGGSAASLVRDVTEALSDVDLVHAYYYQSGEICKAIAGLIKNS